MIIHRIENLSIERTDPYNWTVIEYGIAEKGVNAGKEVPVWRTYHPSLAMACNKAAHLLADHSEAKSLEAYAKRLERVSDELMAIGEPK